MSSLLPVTIGLAAGFAFILLFSITFHFDNSTPIVPKQGVDLSQLKLDFTKFDKYPANDSRLTDEVVKKSVESASKHELVAQFLNKFGGNHTLAYTIRYVESQNYQGNITKPSILVVIEVYTPIEENPRVAVSIEPETYKILGAGKGFWDY
jgi:hypothetical protein